MAVHRVIVCTIGLLVCGVVLAEPGAGLIPNGGFEAGTAQALEGWERLPWGEGGAPDTGTSHSGGRALRVSAHGGMRSELVPYPGGRVKVIGWLRTENVVTGAQPWHKAALQLISYNATKEPVGHSDVALVDGSHDWTRHERTVLLSRDVAYVSVHCHLWGEQTTGTAWFDDISLEFLDEPGTIPRKPVDLERATVTVDFARDLGEFRHLWIGSDVSYMDRVATPTQVNAMRHARRFGFRYLRMHDCVHDPHIYSEDTDGNAAYTWETFDRNISAVVDNGMWPVVVLETMPPELATRDGGLGWHNPYPPRGPAEYLKWQKLVREIVVHCREQWGDDIRNWYFEVWNEPDAEGYFKGTLEEYLKIYDHAVAGATSADPQIRIGGPGGAGTGWCRAFLEHCASGRNDATGGTGCRVDFLSWHIYTVGVGLPAFGNIRASLNDVRRILDELPQYKDLPTLITEWGCASSNNPVHDRPYDAAFRVMAVREFMDAGITLALPFCLGEGPPHAHEGFMGGLALFTKTTIPKPSFRAFELLDRMVGRRIACESSNEPVGGLACVSEDGRRAWVMLYNLIENYRHEPYETEVTVRLANLPSGEWRCAAVAIAPGGCDPYLAWEAIGGPQELTPAQRAALLEASELPQPEPVALARDELRVRMAGFSAMLLSFSR
ncbi:MAG: hypothetical protein JSV65_07895 [Armatimonadota bacterium]|nr:MAG: hypothetical protein JSV65_07895 [Armatimonadota bacterium]